MCGRFTLTVATFDELCALLGVPPDVDAAAVFRPRYNVAPTDTHIILCEEGRRHLAPAVWGLGVDKPQINARSETADSRPTFRAAFARTRCVVPADGFFEWTADRQPIWYHRKDGGLLLMAGMFERDRSGLRFTILTTAANDLIAPVHDRMPVILAPEQVDTWLGRTPLPKLRKLLAPAPADWLVATEVSPRVNSVKNDDAACLDPPPGKPKPRQLRLF
jgi:putative SOS response-associated peptidase YedK